ncbi:uncharacterized protein JCM15063_003103 [Sporobolomyces koalae]|uniref:uncharacterized protein n=1 Tax=Sporobolomyces koalae TaxID=500713 RepID=UPI003176852A
MKGLDIEKYQYCLDNAKEAGWKPSPSEPVADADSATSATTPQLSFLHSHPPAAFNTVPGAGSAARQPQPALGLYGASYGFGHPGFNDHYAVSNDWVHQSQSAAASGSNVFQPTWPDEDLQASVSNRSYPTERHDAHSLHNTFHTWSEQQPSYIHDGYPELGYQVGPAAPSGSGVFDPASGHGHDFQAQVLNQAHSWNSHVSDQPHGAHDLRSPLPTWSHYTNDGYPGPGAWLGGPAAASGSVVFAPAGRRGSDLQIPVLDQSDVRGPSNSYDFQTTHNLEYNPYHTLLDQQPHHDSNAQYYSMAKNQLSLRKARMYRFL